MQSLNEIDFKNVILQKCICRQEVVALASPALLAITRNLLPRLSGSELALLMCLLSLTVATGRIARDVSVRELARGMQEDGKTTVFCGTGLSENSVRSAVRSLDEKGLIYVYKEARRDGSDCAARVYEINFGQLDLILAVRLRTLWAPKRVSDPFKNCRGIHIGNYVTSRSETEATSSFSSVAASGSESNVEKATMPYVGKKSAPASIAAPAASVVAAIQQRSKDKLSQRVAAATSAAPAQITREQMQALFDSAVAQCSIPYRLMVTVREYGFLRKRLEQNPPQDFADLVRYALTYWGVLAQQNRRAAAKADGSVRLAKALPEAPHFKTFAYWYPYFLRAYQNHLAGRNVETMKDETDRRVRQLEHEVASARAVIGSMRRRMAPPTPTPRPSHRGSGADIDLPEWK